MDQALDPLTLRVRRLFSEAGVELGIELPEPEVRADLRGLAAGRCQVTRRAGRFRVMVRFNERVLGEGWLLDDALAETAPHEVAHAALGVWSLAGNRRVRSHGPEWLLLCRALGGSGRATHSLPLQRSRRQRQYEYRLADGERVWLGAVRHRRLQSGRVRYAHRHRAIAPEHYTGRVRRRS